MPSDKPNPADFPDHAAVVIATDLSDFEASDQVDIYINGYWMPCIVLGHSGGKTKIMLRYPLKPDQISVPGRTQARWARVAA